MINAVDGSSARRAFLAAVFVTAAVALRTVALDRIPGLNGDEAWYGVNAQELLAGGTPFRQTPSGNFVNPFHSGPVLLLSLVSEASFVVLRLPEVLWGTLAVLVAYPLLARPVGPRAATIATILLAVCPTAVVYARFGWDPSGSPFFALLALGFALRDRPVLAGLAAAAAFVVHPTNVFLVPVVGGAWAAHAWRRYQNADRSSRKTMRVLAGSLGAIAIPGLLALVVATARMGRLPSIEMVVDRLSSPSGWLEHALAMVRLVSGVTATTYVAGPLSVPLRYAADVVVAITMVVAGLLLWRNSRISASYDGRLLLAGFAASFVTAYVLGGAVGFEPGFERYVIGLLAPLIVLCALGLDALMRQSAAAGKALAALTCAVFICVLMFGYFQPLVASGGNAHPTFRTGEVEPKAAAYAFIRSTSAPDEVVRVFAEEWWIYWPIRYLAARDRGRVFVEMIGVTPPVYPVGVRPPPYPRPPDRVYAVVFDQGNPWLQVRDAGRLVFTAVDPLDRSILHVFDITHSTKPIDFVERAALGQPRD